MSISTSICEEEETERFFPIGSIEVEVELQAPAGRDSLVLNPWFVPGQSSLRKEVAAAELLLYVTFWVLLSPFMMEIYYRTLKHSSLITKVIHLNIFLFVFTPFQVTQLPGLLFVCGRSLIEAIGYLLNHPGSPLIPKDMESLLNKPGKSVLPLAVIGLGSTTRELTHTHTHTHIGIEAFVSDLTKGMVSASTNALSIFQKDCAGIFEKARSSIPVFTFTIDDAIQTSWLIPPVFASSPYAALVTGAVASYNGVVIRTLVRGMFGPQLDSDFFFFKAKLSAPTGFSFLSVGTFSCFLWTLCTTKGAFVIRADGEIRSALECFTYLFRNPVFPQQSVSAKLRALAQLTSRVQIQVNLAGPLGNGDCLKMFATIAVAAGVTAVFCAMEAHYFPSHVTLSVREESPRPRDISLMEKSRRFLFSKVGIGTTIFGVVAGPWVVVNTPQIIGSVMGVNPFPRIVRGLVTGTAAVAWKGLTFIPVAVFGAFRARAASQAQAPQAQAPQAQAPQGALDPPQAPQGALGPHAPPLTNDQLAAARGVSGGLYPAGVQQMMQGNTPPGFVTDGYPVLAPSAAGSNTMSLQGVPQGKPPRSIGGMHVPADAPPLPSSGQGGSSTGPLASQPVAETSCLFDEWSDWID
jgi:hypothetical protein